MASTASAADAQASSIKVVLDQYLRQNNVYGKIRELLAQNMPDQNTLGRDQVLTALQEKGVIADVLKQLSQPASSLTPLSMAGGIDTSSSSSPAAAVWSSSAHSSGLGAPGPAPTRLIPGRRYMHVKLSGGRAFVESLIDEDVAQSASTLQLCLHFRSQRFRSRPVAFTVEPQFNDSFMIDLQHDGMSVVPFESLLELKDQLHVLVLKDRLGVASVVASRFVEWRKVLVHGKLALSVELIGGTADLKTPVGLLDFDLEILPLPPASSALTSSAVSTAAAAAAATGEGDAPVIVGGVPLPVLIPSAVVARQINRERVVSTETEQRFRTYAKTWWKDYQAIRPQHQNRSITMFALAEDGSRRFVSSFITPMTAGRALDSSLHAARFVRLIPFERDVAIGGERAGIWSTPHTFLSIGKGDVENHVLLLCSLLLGFGLEAYVAVGTNSKGAHMWVVTRDEQQHVTYWESLTGRRVQVTGAGAVDTDSLAANYVSVGCVFNHRRFYANAQADDAVISCDWHFDNDKAWKAMSADAIALLDALPAAPLSLPTLHSAAVVDEEERLERELRAHLADRRRERTGLDTAFDDQFGYVLSPSLAAYEFERVAGIAFGNDEFQQAIKHHIPLHHVFKGFPVQFSTRSAARIVAELVQQAAACDIIDTRGDAVRFGLRVKLVQYPEGVCAVWLMLACKFRPCE